MIKTQADFDDAQAQGFNRIPVMREILADLDTPLSTYVKLANAPYSYLFESVYGGEKWGRYSIIGLPARERLVFYDTAYQHWVDDACVESGEAADPLAFIEAFHARYQAPDLEALPRFGGGLVGYFGYETIGYVESRLHFMHKPDVIGAPDVLLMVSDEIVVFDNLSGKLYLVVYANAQLPHAFMKAQARLDSLVTKMRGPVEMPKDQASHQRLDEGDFVSGFSQAGFEAAIEQVKEYIRAGDVMQVVLSQRLSIPYAHKPMDLYRALRHLNPSPYMFYMDLAEFHVVGASPEIMVRLEGDEVTVRPIAGTRPRGRTEKEDVALEHDLLGDEKELAEHLMLIDLGRNDVGRVARLGSVKLTDKMSIERYSHVMHIVSNVIGRVPSEITAMDVLRATFPAGTVSGAPKIRAMEIIYELEPTKRGIYSGAVGYWAWNGNMDLAIAIRTAVIKDEVLYVQAGAGLVADSVAKNEWDETMNKARAIFKAVKFVTQGLKSE